MVSPRRADPSLYTSYVSNTRNFFSDSGNRGAGKIGSIPGLSHDLNGEKLVVWDGTGGAGHAFLTEVLAAAGVTAVVEQIASPDDIVKACPGSLSSVSPCYGAVYFDVVNEQTGQLVRIVGIL